LRAEAGDLPPECEIKGRQRWVGVGECAVWDERASTEEIIGSGDVIACLVPVIRQVQQREVSEIESNEDERKDQPQGEVLVSRLDG